AWVGEIGGGGAERERAVGSEVHPLEHAVAARVVAGQVVHALLAEDEQAVEPLPGHLPAGGAAASPQLLLREVQHQMSVRRRSSALAPSTAHVTAMRNELTAAIVGSTSSSRLFQTRTVTVGTSTPARKSGINSSSNEVRNAKSAADMTPGAISGSVTRRSAVTRLAPRLRAASSRRRSKPCRVAVMMIT